MLGPVVLADRDGSAGYVVSVVLVAGTVVSSPRLEVGLAVLENVWNDVSTRRFGSI